MDRVIFVSHVNREAILDLFVGLRNKILYLFMIDVSVSRTHAPIFPNFYLSTFYILRVGISDVVPTFHFLFMKSLSVEPETVKL